MLTLLVGTYLTFVGLFLPLDLSVNTLDNAAVFRVLK